MLHKSNLLDFNSKLIGNAIDQHAMIIVSTLEGKIVHVNDLLCEAVGYQQQELIGQKNSILSAEKTNQHMFMIWPVISAGDSWKGMSNMQHKNGSKIFCYEIILPICEVKDEISHYVSIRYDNKRNPIIHRDMQAQRKKLQAVFDSVNDAIFVLDAENMLISDFNSKAIEMLEIDPADMKTRSILANFSKRFERCSKTTLL